MSSTTSTLSPSTSHLSSNSNSIYALSIYAPMITLVSIFVFSIFSSAVVKGLFYLFWAMVATLIRMGLFYYLHRNQSNSGSSNGSTSTPCDRGALLPYTNMAYSSYLLSFTLCYFLVPAYVVSKQQHTNSMNYMVLLFFLVYLIMDASIKFSLRCIPSLWVFCSDVLGGLALGILLLLLLCHSPMRSYLFINEMDSNNETCSVPQNQTYKCSVYKNGQIIG